MYAFYNPETQKYMYYYPYTSYDEGVIHSLDRDSTELLFVHHNRQVLEAILDNYKNPQHGGGTGFTIETVEVDRGILDGFEIVQLCMTQ